MPSKPRRAESSHDSQSRPTALDIFTDRVNEQTYIRDLFTQLCATPYSHPAKPLLSFYGVGGIGKSTLREQAITNWQAHQLATKPAVMLDCIVCDLDKTAFNPDTKPMEFYGGTLRPLLLRAGIKPVMFDLLYMAWWGKTNPNRELNLEDGIDGLLGNLGEASSTLSSFVEALGSLASGIEAVQLGKKSLGVLKQKLRERRYLKEFEDKPLESLSEDELAEHAPTVLAEDILHHLRGAHGKKALCLVLDGFERIQKDVKHRKDLQWSLQGLCGNLAMEEDQRVGMILLGREKLEWSRLYDTPDAEEPWDKLIDAHLLGDLVENDARDFIQKVVDWGQKNAPRLAEQVRANVEPILTAANEAPAGIPRQFHPYTLDLAITLIARLGERFTPERLGHGSAELQERFLRHLKEDGRLEAFQVLALALEFDKPLFDHLVQQQRLKGYTPQDFHKLIGREWTFIRKDDIHAGRYRFHGKMQQSLLGSLRDTYLAGTNQAVAEIVGAIAQHFQSGMRQALEAHAIGLAKDIYERLSNSLLELQDQGHLTGKTAAKLLEETENGIDKNLLLYFNTTLQISVHRRTLEWFEREMGGEHPLTVRNLKKLADLLIYQRNYVEAELLDRRVLAIREKTPGPDHSDTVASLHDLANLLKYQRKYVEAELLYRRAFAILENALGPEHPDTATSLDKLASLMDRQGNCAGAELFYHRALAIRENALGPEHPDTATSLDKLASLMDRQGDCAGAELFYRRALAIREKAPGSEHSGTATSLDNLASLLDRQGDYAGAELLYRRALAIREKTLGPEHYDTLSSLRSLAHLLVYQGDSTGAELIYRRALANCEKALGPDHPDVATILEKLASLLEGQGDYAGAEILCRRALVVFEKFLGPEDSQTVLCLENLNDYVRNQVNCSKAKAPLHTDNIN